ncbi:hypothetical protein [Streptomyces sp. NPDC005780]
MARESIAQDIGLAGGSTGWRGPSPRTGADGGAWCTDVIVSPFREPARL